MTSGQRHAGSLALAAALLAQVALAVPASAAPGDLDPSFGSGGTVTAPFEGSIPKNSYDDAVVAQPDGKVIAAGSAGPIVGGDGLLLVRYGLDGSLDQTFGTAGVVTTDLGSSPEAQNVVLLPDGRIVVVARVANGNSTLTALARYEPDGSLDPTFGNGGTVETDLGDHAVGSGLALQSDGKILVAGLGTVGSQFGGQAELVVARFDTGGSLDASFGSGGVVKTNFSAPSFGDQAGVAVQSNDQIVAASEDQSGSIMARYQPDGSLDPGFGAAGKVVASPAVSPKAPLIQPDGKIVVGGGTTSGFVLLRFNADGTPDASFGSGGAAEYQHCCASGNGLGLQADGKIVAAGMGFRTGEQFAAVRFNPDGTPDTGFGNGGEASTDVGGEFSRSVAGIALASGRVVIVGDFGDCLVATRSGCEASTSDLVLTGFNSSGSLDPGFGLGGKVTTSLGDVSVPASSSAETLLIQPDRKLLAVGTAATFLEQNLALARFEPDGHSDPTFGSGGSELEPESAGPPVDALLQPSGRIVVAERRGLVRLDADGAADSSFGEGGTVAVRAKAAAVAARGKLLVAGMDCCGTNAPSVPLSLARLQRNGALDTSFARGRGRVRLRTGTPSAVIVQNGGRIIVVGSQHMCAVKSGGVIDRHFGHRGCVATPKRGLIGGAVGAGRGRILLYGTRGGHLALYRFRANGKPDRSFGVRGKAIASSLHPGTISVVPRHGGRLLITSSFGTHVGIARFKANGRLDHSFGDHGLALSSVSGESNDAGAVAGGRIVVAGNTLPAGGASSQLLLARFLG